MRLLRNHCSHLGIEPLNDEYEPWRILRNDDGTVKVILSLLDLPPIRLGLKGHHQVENAQTAVQIARALLYHGLFLNLQDGEEEVRIVEGLQNARHPGRLENQGKYLLDGAHNAGGAKALAAFIEEYEKRPITMVFGAMNDKSVAEILSILAPIAERMVVTEPSNSRSLSYAELLEKLPSNLSKENTFATDHVQQAITIAREITPPDGIILVTGSLYLVGEAKRILSSQI